MPFSKTGAGCADGNAAADEEDEGLEEEEEGGVFKEWSTSVGAADSGDQPLCLFLGGPALAWRPVRTHG